MELMSIPISSIHDPAEMLLLDEINQGNDIAAENLQSRLRGLLVMGVANARGAMAMATGNKSELAMGIAHSMVTWQEDTHLSGRLKTEVYALAHTINDEVVENG